MTITANADGWLSQPQEWHGIPQPRRRYGELRRKLDSIVAAGAAGRPFLVRTVPVSQRGKLQRQASNYRRDYRKEGFAFQVSDVPKRDADGHPVPATQAGLWTVWTPPNSQSTDSQRDGETTGSTQAGG